MGHRTYNGGMSAVYSPFFLIKQGKAPIHLAAEREDGIACVATLIAHQADVNLRTSGNVTTLQLALEAGTSRKQMVSMLLDAGAEPNAVLDQHGTILHPVAAMGLVDILDLLLKAGGDTSVRNAFGQTALDVALRYKHTQTAMILQTEALSSHGLADATDVTPIFNIPKIIADVDQISQEAGASTTPFVDFDCMIQGRFEENDPEQNKPRRVKSISAFVTREWTALKDEAMRHSISIIKKSISPKAETAHSD